jgi:hypothetical protein
MVMPFIELLDPTSAPRAKDRPLARRLDSLAGRRIGFLSNGKANAGLLLAGIESLLGARFGGLAIVWHDKGAAEPAPDEVMERLRGCDAVITAIAD